MEKRDEKKEKLKELQKRLEKTTKNPNNKLTLTAKNKIDKLIK